MSEPNMVQRFREAPRAIQWLAAAGLLMLVFLVWDETTTLADGLKRDADKLQMSIDDVHDAEALITELKVMRDLMGSVGPVEKPGSKEDGSQALTAAVNAVLAEFDVSPDSVEFSNREGQKLHRDIVKDLGGSKTLGTGSNGLGTWRGDLQFVASPAVAVSVVAALESNPAIERVQNLTIDKNGASDLRVQLVLEAWVVNGGQS
jgi:hypothetical protein